MGNMGNGGNMGKTKIRGWQMDDSIKIINLLLHPSIAPSPTVGDGAMGGDGKPSFNKINHKICHIHTLKFGFTPSGPPKKESL